MSEVLIKAEHVSKKFCRSLKRSLWYGVKDVAHSLNPWALSQDMDDDGALHTDVNLRKDEFWALQDINFEVRRGECLGLIGHNGAGKSTLLKILNGLIRPDAGRVTMRGRVAAMIELGAGFNPLLTGRENIFNQAALLGFSRSEVRKKFDEIVDFSEIEEALDMPLQNYSSGMRVRLGFAVFAHLEPDVLLIDEVLAVGDVGFRFKSLNKMSDLMSRCAVIFVTHAMPQVFRVCSEVMLLNHGQIEFCGTGIAEGVDRYFNAFPQGEQSVTGSGDAKVLALKAQGPNGSATLEESISINSGDPLEISVRLHLKPGFATANVQLLFWNTELLPVLEILTEQLAGFDFSVDESGGATVVAKIPHVNLNAGKYNLSVIVLSPDLKVLCRHDGALVISVVANCASGASVVAPASWNSSADPLPCNSSTIG